MKTKQIFLALLTLDAHLSSNELSCLCLAIYYSQQHLPLPVPMHVICSEIKNNLGMTSSSSVLRCIERAVDRIFKFGDISILAAYQTSWAFEPPAPNEFVRVLAIHLLDDSSLAPSTLA